MDYEGKICRPAFEKGAFKLPISVGCSYNQCKFCCLFKYLNFKTIDDEIVFAEIDRVKNATGKPEVCFLGDGNAFHNDTERLIKIITYLKENIPSIKKIRMDSTITDIKNKTDDELNKLSDKGVDVLYIGIESGLDDVLLFMNKEHRTNAEAISQIDRLHKFNIDYSAHIMAGVSGKGRNIENAKALAKFFNETKPVSITNFTMFTSRKQKLYKDVLEGKFEAATEVESLNEAKELISGINIETDIDSFHDYIPFRVKGHLPYDKEKLTNQIDSMLKKLQLKKEVKLYIVVANDKDEDNIHQNKHQNNIINIVDRIGFDYQIIDEVGNEDLIDKIYDKALLDDLAKRINIESLNKYFGNELADACMVNPKKPQYKLVVVSNVRAVVFENKILGKAKNREEAYKMLKMLSGKRHLVVSSMCVYYNGKYNIKNEETEVFFRNLSDEEIYRYIDGAKPFDKYGGYDIQDEFFDFEDNYIGTYNNVAGFPLNILIDILNELKLTMNN